MDKKKWLWKRRSLERSPGETENSGSLSSLSERLSDERITDVINETPAEQSPEVTSKASDKEDEVNDTVKALAEKLTAALVNVSAKDDLVRQHSKVAEEAVAGWEKAENEALTLKKQLANSVKQKLALEDRMTHLDAALKECVRQLRVSRDEQEVKIEEAVAKRTEDLETHLKEANLKLEMVSKAEEKMGIEYLEEENATLRYELEVRTIDRNLSSQAAETASKQHLESIKKIAKLEAECRKLKFLIGKASNDHKTPSVSSLYVDSFTDSQSDCGDRMNAVELDSDNFNAALVVDIDLMEDFIEMEKLAALPESEPEMTAKVFNQAEIDALLSKNTELEVQIIELASLNEKSKLLLKESKAEIDALMSRNSELEEQIIELESLNEKSKLLLKETEIEITSLKERVSFLNESKQEIEGKVKTLEKELESERMFSTELAVKYEEVKEECEIHRTVRAQISPKINQEDMDLAAGKYAECQKTILSLGNQLKSLATLEDFLIDTVSVPILSEKESDWSELIKNQSENSGICDVNRNGFAKFFSRSKNGLQLEI